MAYEKNKQTPSRTLRYYHVQDYLRRPSGSTRRRVRRRPFLLEARRSKERPYPPHPAGLCLEHFFSMIRDKSVKLKNGKYICSEKQLDGSWKYSASDTHIPRPKKKSAFFVQTKEEELLNQIIQESGLEEEGTIYEEDFQQVLEHVRSVGTKRKREEQNSVFAVEKFIDETSTAGTGN